MTLITFAEILFIIGCIGIVVSLACQFYVYQHPEKHGWSETAHDVAGRAFLIWFAALFFFLLGTK